MPNDKTIALCQLCKGDINVGEEHICKESQEPQNREETGRNPDGTFKEGFSGNPGGRPKGSLKDYVKNKLAEMNPEEKEDFLKKINPEFLWRMGEGNPEQKSETDLKHTGEISIRDLFDRSK